MHGTLRTCPGDTSLPSCLQVDKVYKDVMRRTHDRPDALMAGTVPGAPRRREPALVDPCTRGRRRPCLQVTARPWWAAAHWLARGQTPAGTRCRANSVSATPPHAAPHPGLFESLARCRGVLEEVAKALEGYLEYKRAAFPRCEGRPCCRGHRVCTDALPTTGGRADSAEEVQGSAGGAGLASCKSRPTAPVLLPLTPGSTHHHLPTPPPAQLLLSIQ